MNVQHLPLKSGKVLAGPKLWAKQRSRSASCQNEHTRDFASAKPATRQSREELSKEIVRDLSTKQKAKQVARELDRDFFISVLGSSATKRDAKAYLKAFTPQKQHTAPRKEETSRQPSSQTSKGNFVNLGAFYGNARAVVESPKFVQQPEKLATVVDAQLHVALVKIRALQTLDNNTLDGIGRTLSQLGRLGLTSIVVVDCSDGSRAVTGSQYPNWRQLAIEQADRVVAAIDSHALKSSGGGGRFVDNVIGVSEKSANPKSQAYLPGQAHVTLRKLLMTPLRRGIIPVIPSLGYTETSQMSVPVPADEVILALTREFAGLQSTSLPDEGPNLAKERIEALRREATLARLIVLDPLGGIPASDRENGYHVFLNMVQEYDSARSDLLEVGRSKQAMAASAHISEFKLRSFFSSHVPGAPAISKKVDKMTTTDAQAQSMFHLQNLDLVRAVLSILPPTSSALLTTPEEAANSGKEPDAPFQAAGVGTRRKRNPLIHNLLTDKPVFSSSLPMGRLGPVRLLDQPLHSVMKVTPTTFAKHGMPVTIFPDPKVASWVPPEPGKPYLSLTDSHIDLPRLVHLIEDSFGRKLDVKDYLKRVEGHIAGVIIAGEYEGGAILTWEIPPGVPADGSPQSRARMVPYLDKFAVLKKSQGSGGTADVVFKAMVRDCFPEGVCWRSRKTNVVNKWYFERSRGTWKLPDTGWTMFWTTPDLSLDQQKFRDYEAVCKGVEPSWADNKHVPD